MKIISVSEIEKAKRNGLPPKAGVYAFWWLGERNLLLSGITEIQLLGPAGKWGPVIWQNWWPQELEYPCLYW